MYRRHQPWNVNTGPRDSDTIYLTDGRLWLSTDASTHNLKACQQLATDLEKITTIQDLESATRALYVRLAQTHSGEKAEEEGWLDEWNILRSALATLTRNDDAESSV